MKLRLSFWSWDAETRKAYRALQAYRRTGIRLLRGKPSLELARLNFDAARHSLEQTLRIPRVADRIGAVLAARETKDGAANLSSIKNGTKELDLEIDLASHFGLRRRDVEKSLRNGESAPDTPADVISSDALVAKLNEFHVRIVERANAARITESREVKKQRKRSIGQAIGSIVFGTGCTIANSYVIAGMPTMAVSYSVALAALHQALRDLIGKPPDD